MSQLHLVILMPQATYLYVMTANLKSALQLVLTSKVMC